MPSVSYEERKRVNHELKMLGFGGLQDSNLVPQIAFCIGGHDQFRGMLLSVKPEQRKLAYEVLRPHLRFAAKPLDVYEAEGKRLAEQKQLPVWDGSAYPKPFKTGEVESEEYRLAKVAEEAIQQSAFEKSGGKLEMVCTNCSKAALFPAKKREEARKDAYNKGWRWAERNGSMKVYCPEHVPTRLTVKLKCAKCHWTAKTRAWDEQDGYAAARLCGWAIADDCICPRCNVKIILQ